MTKEQLKRSARLLVRLCIFLEEKDLLQEFSEKIFKTKEYGFFLGILEGIYGKLKREIDEWIRLVYYGVINYGDNYNFGFFMESNKGGVPWWVILILFGMLL